MTFAQDDAQPRKAFFVFPKQKVMAAFLSLGLLSACASAPPANDPAAVQAYQEANDPLEPFNRAMFAINYDLDLFILRPLAVAYRDLVPDFLKDMISNFLSNLSTPVTLANNLLQGDLDGAGDTMGRFLGNTTLGLGGLFDPMAATIPERQEDFGQTLGVWGVGEGYYVMLPLFGPSSPRDTTGRIVDNFFDPVNWYVYNTGRTWINLTRTGVYAVDARSRNIATLDEVERASLDYYAAIRSLYRQRRMDEIRNRSASNVGVTGQMKFDFDDAAGLPISN